MTVEQIIKKYTADLNKAAKKTIKQTMKSIVTDQPTFDELLYEGYSVDAVIIEDDIFENAPKKFSFDDIVDELYKTKYPESAKRSSLGEELKQDEKNLDKVIAELEKISGEIAKNTAKEINKYVKDIQKKFNSFRKEQVKAWAE